MTHAEIYRAGLEAAAKVADGDKQACLDTARRWHGKNPRIVTAYKARSETAQDIADCIRALPVPEDVGGSRIARTAEEDYPFSDASLFDGCIIGGPEDAGVVLVPREPTEKMLSAGHTEMEKVLGYMIHQPVIRDIYCAMINAKE